MYNAVMIIVVINSDNMGIVRKMAPLTNHPESASK